LSARGFDVPAVAGRLALLACLVIPAAASQAQVVLQQKSAAAEVVVSEAWVRGTVSQQKATGAYMQLKASQDSRVVEVRSPIAGVTELHQASIVDGRMSMRAIEALDLPAGKVVELKPGGFHIMLMELKGALVEGDSVPIALVIERADRTRSTLNVTAAVRPLASRVTAP
jgi:copper(I)-binding protein